MFEMWYNTEYELKIMNGDKNIIDVLREHNEDAAFAINVHGGVNNPCTWYEHENDMKRFSSLYHDVVFELYGEGEDVGDIWKKYFKNGRMQEARTIIRFEAYDENKLV